MSSDWDKNAKAWIEHVGVRGDFSREYVLDPVMLARVRSGFFKSALDVGCGEGRFCRLLAKENIPAIGIDPTDAFIAEARKQDPKGDYRLGGAEALGFDDSSFDLVVSYLTLIDIKDFRTAIAEMTRVLAPGRKLLVANVASFFSAGPPDGLRSDELSGEAGFPIDHYFDECVQTVKIGNVHVRNWHRPFSAYMECFLAMGLRLIHFAEPLPVGGDPELQQAVQRVPAFVVLEWQKPWSDDNA